MSWPYVAREEKELLDISSTLMVFASILDRHGLQLDAISLRGISARLREKSGDPNAWDTFNLLYDRPNTKETDVPGNPLLDRNLQE